MVRIRLLDETDAQQYQALRLAALQHNPEAFGSTYEREVEFPLVLVGERLRPEQDRFVLGAFDEEGALVGMVVFMRETGAKFSHKGNVFGMYVGPESRGEGIGKLLLEELLRRAKQCEGLEQINLAVVSDNIPAKRLYSSLGFTIYGMEQNALKWQGRYFHEDWMVLRLQK